MIFDDYLDYLDLIHNNSDDNDYLDLIHNNSDDKDDDNDDGRSCSLLMIVKSF